MSYSPHRTRERQPMFSAKAVRTNPAKTYARLSNGTIVRLHRKPYRDKAGMKVHKRMRRAIREEQTIAMLAEALKP